MNTYERQLRVHAHIKLSGQGASARSAAQGDVASCLGRGPCSEQPPAVYVRLALSSGYIHWRVQGSIVGVEDAGRRLFGLQYHPEVAHSERGRELLRHFLFQVARVPADWRMEDVLQEEMGKVSAVVRGSHPSHPPRRPPRSLCTAAQSVIPWRPQKLSAFFAAKAAQPHPACCNSVDTTCVCSNSRGGNQMQQLSHPKRHAARPVSVHAAISTGTCHVRKGGPARIVASGC